MYLPYILQHHDTYVAIFIVSTCTGIGTGTLAIGHDSVSMLTLKSTSAEQLVLQLGPVITCHRPCSSCCVIQRQRYEHMK